MSSKANHQGDNWQCPSCGLMNGAKRKSCQACFFKPMTFQIGDKIIVKKEHAYKYRDATIVSIQGTRLRIYLDNHYREDEYEWIDYMDGKCTISEPDSYFTHQALPLFAPESSLSDIVYYDKHAGHEITYNNKQYYVMTIKDIVLVE